MESSGSSSRTGGISEGSSGASSSCLEGTTVVPDISEHADRSYPVDNAESEEASELRSHGSTSSASHMAHLRDKF